MSQKNRVRGIPFESPVRAVGIIRPADTHRQFFSRHDCGRNSALRYFRWVDLHISNALELDGWVIWGVRTMSLPRRSGSRRLQGAGKVSE
jgi:hypothetical protein